MPDSSLCSCIENYTHPSPLHQNDFEIQIDLSHPNEIFSRIETSYVSCSHPLPHPSPMERKEKENKSVIQKNRNK
jgi:hypothetical protein